MTDLEQRLSAASPEATGSAVAAAYEAGRRDATADRSTSLTRWRIAAGLLLATTVGLAVLPGDEPPVGPVAKVVPHVTTAEPVVETSASDGPVRVDAEPESVFALRALVLDEGDIRLDRLPMPSVGRGYVDTRVFGLSRRAG